MEEEPPESFHLEDFDEAFQKVSTQVTTDLATCATMLQRLLMAVDLFPLGGLCRGHYAEQAIRRYWLLWMPLLHERQSFGTGSDWLIPPLDVQWAWFVHRLNPEKYIRDCSARFGGGVHPANIRQALGFSSGGHHVWEGELEEPGQQDQQLQGHGQEEQGQQRGQDPAAAPGRVTTRQVWEAAYPAGPDQLPEYVFWPPAPAASTQQQQHQQHPGAKPSKCQQPLPHDKCRLHCKHHQHQHQQTTSGIGVVSTSAAGSADGAVAESDPRIGSLAPSSPGAGGGGGGDVVPTAAALGAKAAGPDQPTAGSGVAGAGCSGGAPEPGSLASVRGYVADAMVRQGRFLHQMLRYFYQDPCFLRSGRNRYLRFLALARTQEPDAPLLNPLYDQDIMWHSHMALSGAYMADCEALMPPGRRPLSHDDSLSAVSLADSFAFTLGRYEKLTGLMVNPSPTRRIPTFIAQPLVAQMWPLAAALADPRVTHMPPPRKIAAELRAGGMQGQHMQARRWGLGIRGGSKGAAGGGGGGMYSRVGVFVGDPDAAALAGPAGGAGRPSMLGSPDHTCRSGGFAMYGLWCLAERLGLGLGPGQEERRERGKAAVGAGQQGGEPSGKGAACGPRRAVRGGCRGRVGERGGLRLLGGCFAGSAAAREEQREGEAEGCRDAGVSKAELDAAFRHMTAQLLRLADLTDPTSPLATHHHPFWEHIAPLPPPQPPQNRNPPQNQTQQQQQEQPMQPPSSSAPASPAESSSSPKPPLQPPSAAPSSSAGSGCGPRRHPAAAPPLDLPSAYLSAKERSAESAYLAPHPYAVRGQVCYTPSDFCLLGPGRWCLPPPLAAEIAERQAAEADTSSAVVYDDRADVEADDDRRRRQHHGRFGDGGDADADDDDGYGGRPLRLRGNALGCIMFSRTWPDRMADCYRQVHGEMQRRAAAAN